MTHLRDIGLSQRDLDVGILLSKPERLDFVLSMDFKGIELLLETICSLLRSTVKNMRVDTFF